MGCPGTPPLTAGIPAAGHFSGQHGGPAGAKSRHGALPAVTQPLYLLQWSQFYDETLCPATA